MSIDQDAAKRRYNRWVWVAFIAYSLLARRNHCPPDRQRHRDLAKPYAPTPMIPSPSGWPYVRYYDAWMNSISAWPSRRSPSPLPAPPSSPSPTASWTSRECRASTGGSCGPVMATLWIRRLPGEEALAVKNTLRELRAERGWTQADLSDELGVSRQTVNAIETGSTTPASPSPSAFPPSSTAPSRPSWHPDAPAARRKAPDVIRFPSRMLAVSSRIVSDVGDWRPPWGVVLWRVARNGPVLSPVAIPGPAILK